MNNIKNEMDKNFKKREELKKENGNIKKEVDKICNQELELYKISKNKISFDDEIKTKYNNLRVLEKQKADEFLLNQYKIANINNNIDLLLNKIVVKELFAILKKYQNKKIGEKTKEKINAELEQYILNKYGFIFYFNFYKEYDFSSTYKISFYFDSVGEIIKNYNPETKEIYNYFTNLDYKYINLDKIDDYSQKMLSERLKTVKKLDDLRKKMNNLIDGFNNNYVFNKTKDFRIENK